MNNIHIHITGPAQSGKTTAATKIQEALAGLGYKVSRTENGGPIPRDRQRLYARHDWPTFQPREVTINDQWDPEKPVVTDELVANVETLVIFIANVCERVGLDADETKVRLRRKDDHSVVMERSLAELCKDVLAGLK